MKKEKPRCPKCNSVLKWDWEQDVFIVNGKYCTQIEVSNEHSVELDEIVIVFVCLCGQVLGTFNDGEVSNIKELQNYDWEQESN